VARSVKTGSHTATVAAARFNAAHELPFTVEGAHGSGRSGEFMRLRIQLLRAGYPSISHDGPTRRAHTPGKICTHRTLRQLDAGTQRIQFPCDDMSAPAIN